MIQQRVHLPMVPANCTRPWPKWGTAVSLLAIAAAMLAWFLVWASDEYHARGGVTARLGFLYLPEFARKEGSVYAVIEISLRHRGLYCGAAVFPLSIAAIFLCASSRPAARALSTVGLAVILLPALYFLLRLIC